MSSRERIPSRLRVLILDPHEVSRAAIRALLRTEGLDVIDVATANQALAAGAQAAPDIAIVDISTEQEPAIATARALAQLPSAPTVLLTSSTPVSVDPDDFTFLAKRDICARRLRVAMQPANDTTESTMSMQTYLDNITAKTGKTPEELIELARADGLLQPGWKAGQIIAWLKDRYGLGHGHAMAVVATVKKQGEPQPSTDQKLGKHFTGRKAAWRPVYDELLRNVNELGADTDVVAGASYLSLRKAGKKFAIVHVTAERLDVGIKLKGTAATARLEPAGDWNRMVTHRVRIHAPADLDHELLEWLEQAYARA